MEIRQPLVVEPLRLRVFRPAVVMECADPRADRHGPLEQRLRDRWDGVKGVLCVQNEERRRKNEERRGKNEKEKRYKKKREAQESRPGLPVVHIVIVTRTKCFRRS